MVEKFIMAGRTAVHVCDSEKGEKAVVLLHGYLESMLVWDTFIPFIYKDFRVITMDLPGHGISVVTGPVHTMEFLADTVDDAVMKLGVERYTVVGHSMGGYVALSLCERHAEHLEGIVLLSSTPNADSDEKKANREREIRLIESGKKELLAHTAPSAGFAPENVERFSDDIEDLAETIHITENDGIKALLRGMIARKDQNEMLLGSAVRQMFILGRRDGYITAETAEAMVARHPQAKVAWLANSGHMGFIEEPEECARAMREFVEGK